jgi:acetyl esterase/lipase
MAFTPLGLLNALLPADADTERCGAAIAYGPAPRQALDVYRPRHGASGLVTVLFFYGGSWMSGQRRDYSFVGHAFAAQGFIAVIADYRVVPRIAYPAFLHDCAAAFAWVEQQIEGYGGDPNVIHVAGHSAGAYNAAMIALAPDFRCGARASVKPASLVGLSGPYDFLPLDSPTTRQVFGSVPDLPATQPICHVSPQSPPAFLATGDRDRLVYPRNTRSLAAALRQNGRFVEERHYPGIGHAGLLLALSRGFRLRVPVLTESAEFMRKIGAKRAA